MHPLWKNLLYTTFLLAIVNIVPLFFVSAAEIANPIGQKSLTDLIKTVSNAILIIATPIAIVAIIFVGFKFVIAAAQGDTSGMGEAKKMLTWVLIGTAVVVGASALATVVVNFAKTLTQ